MLLIIGLCFFLVIFILLQAHQTTAVFNITAAESLFQNQNLVSSSQIFELGFFTPTGSANQYVGIWYKNATPSKIIWVANRDMPLAYSDQSAKLTIGSDGNLKLVDEKQKVVWCTNVSALSNYTTALLSDDGKFILQDGNSNEIWASFDDPTDTLLPNMKIGVNTRNGERRDLVSWKSDNDPSSGNFVTGITTETPPQLVTWNGAIPFWRSGPWDKSVFIGIAGMDSSYFNGFNLQQDLQRGTTYFSTVSNNNSLLAYCFTSPGGIFTITHWDDGSKSWLNNWVALSNSCDFYGTCGPFGICNSLNSPICRCIKGFTPRSKEEWKSGNWTGGCIRETELNCQKNISRSASMQVKNDVFVQMNQVKVPDSAEYFLNIRDEGRCQIWCLNNCSCLAYSYVSTIGCLVWAKGLMDIQEFSTVGQHIYIRVAHDNIGMSSQEKLIISTSTVIAMMIIGAAILGLSRWRASKRGAISQGNEWKDQLKQDDASELTLFNFSSLLLATDNFDATNKLGQGGFGPVYKVKAISKMFT